MTIYNYPKIFYTTLANAFVTFTSLFFFFDQTGDEYKMKNYFYTEATCLPGNNAWHVKHCTLAMPKVTPDMAPVKCYYNNECKIYLTEPKTFPIWFWLILFVFIFILTWFAPSPSNMRHWKGD